MNWYPAGWWVRGWWPLGWWTRVGRRAGAAGIVFRVVRPDLGRTAVAGVERALTGGARDARDVDASARGRDLVVALPTRDLVADR